MGVNVPPLDTKPTSWPCAPGKISFTALSKLKLKLVEPISMADVTVVVIPATGGTLAEVIVGESIEPSHVPVPPEAVTVVPLEIVAVAEDVEELRTTSFVSGTVAEFPLCEPDKLAGWSSKVVVPLDEACVALQSATEHHGLTVMLPLVCVEFGPSACPHQLLVAIMASGSSLKTMKPKEAGADDGPKDS